MGSKRLKSPNSIYHIFNRGVKGAAIFPEIEDRFSFHYILEDVKEKNGLNFITHAYTQMDNHFHLLLQTFNDDISKIMQILESRFAKKLNSRYNQKGYVFQNRFGSRMIFNNYHFLIAQAYIHNNWHEAGKEENTTNKLFCSYSSFLDQKSLFRHFDPKRSLKLYRDPDQRLSDKENFKLFTQEKRKSEYEIEYEFSDYLFIIKAFANIFQESDKWLIISLLLRNYTNAQFKEISKILNFNQVKIFRNKYYREISRISEENKEKIFKRFEDFASNGAPHLGGEMHAVR